LRVALGRALGFGERVGRNAVAVGLHDGISIGLSIKSDGVGVDAHVAQRNGAAERKRLR